MGKKKRKNETLTHATMLRSSSRRRRRRKRPRPPPPSPEWRDWSSPPSDILLFIFCRIPHADILHGAGQVCATWRRLAVTEPSLWRRIELSTDDRDVRGHCPPKWRGMARAAIDRSAGGCESFRGPADMDLLAYLAGRSPSLRSNHVTSWLRVPEKEFVAGVIRKLPLLERLVLSSGIFDEPEPVMRALLDHCPRLELLNAGGSVTAAVTSRRVRARCAERIRDLRLPEYFYVPLYGCRCCFRPFSQEELDEFEDSDELDDTIN